MEFSSLNTGLKVFLSRAITGGQGEDLVEKQNAEQGLMPVVEDEAGIYGYIGENRHMVECFRTGEQPIETFHDGVAVVEMLMALYRSAEIGQVVQLPAADSRPMCRRWRASRVMGGQVPTGVPREAEMNWPEVKAWRKTARAKLIGARIAVPTAVRAAWTAISPRTCARLAPRHRRSASIGRSRANRTCAR